MSRWPRARPIVIVALLGALVATVVHPVVYTVWFSFGFHKGVRTWMLAHGLGPYIGFTGIILELPQLFLAFVGGSVIGLVQRRRWFPLAVVYGAAMFVAPYVSGELTGLGMVKSINRWGGWVVLESVVWGFSVVPFAVLGGWIAGRWKRNNEETSSGLPCDNCGYDLTGNISGVCPECGQRR